MKVLNAHIDNVLMYILQEVIDYFDVKEDGFCNFVTFFF